jgi:hypothetical protein
MAIQITVGLEGDIPQSEAEQLQRVSSDRMKEVLVSGLFANGLITSKAAMALMEQTRREFYAMLSRNNVPLSSRETDEDIENNRSVYQLGL